MLRFAAIAIFLFSRFGVSMPVALNFPPLYSDPTPFAAALATTDSPAISAKISGITLPHHLLAADLIASGLSQISAQKYDQIVIIAPDHFDRGETKFSTTTKNFNTIFGEVAVAQSSVEKLLADSQITESNLFSHEHGIQVFLPFLKKYFPDTPIVPIAVKISADENELKKFAASLEKILTPETLILQSTDFSHYLSAKNATLHDEETLRALVNGDPDAIFALDESDNLDSRGAQFLQFFLQKNYFSATPTIFENRNSEFYSDEKVDETTSYLVQFWSREPLDFPHEKYFFAGDTFFGRSIFTKFSNGKRRDKMIQKILEITHGAKMIVNLEGVVREKCDKPRNDYELCIPLDFALPILQKLNIVAVGLANNHRHDFGVAGYDEMKKLLAENKIAFFEAGEIFKTSEFDLVALTDLDNFGIPRFWPLIRDSDFEFIKKSDKPLFAFLHFGSEFVTEPNKRDRELIAKLRGEGVEFVIGAHSHRASELDCQPDFCQIFSLGNFIFDQTYDYTSGKLLEIDFFANGNYFPRLHTIPNFYTQF
ncbi:MAG: AmmeMemoRadiSam system protein B [Patescibacteria group bacterium]